jgi:hypothetical protein
LPTRPTIKAFAVSKLLFSSFHGMEEVVGSIPTRSTKSPNNLDGKSPYSNGVCVMVYVITRRFGAQRKGFHRCALRFHADVAVPLQHSTAHVTGNRHNYQNLLHPK